MMIPQKGFALVLVAAVMSIMGTSVAVSVLVTSNTIPNSGNITAIGVLVYWDNGCTNHTTMINWDTMSPGSTKSYTIYLKNNGTSAERLSMTTNSWSPAGAQNSISLAWNRDSYLLNPSAVVSATLTLNVSSSVSVTDFDFNIVITGTEQ